MKWALWTWTAVAMLVASFCIHYAVYRDGVGWLAVIAMLSSATGGFLIAVNIFVLDNKTEKGTPA